MRRLLLPFAAAVAVAAFPSAPAHAETPCVFVGTWGGPLGAGNLVEQCVPVDGFGTICQTQTLPEPAWLVVTVCTPGVL